MDVAPVITGLSDLCTLIHTAEPLFASAVLHSCSSIQPGKTFIPFTTQESLFSFSINYYTSYNLKEDDKQK